MRHLEVCVIAPAAIGDSVVFNPLLKTLAVGLPHIRITVAGPAALAPLYRLFPGVARVVELPQCSAALSKRSFDIVIDVLCTDLCLDIVRQLDSAQKIGMDFSDDRSGPYTVALPHWPATGIRSAIDLYLDFARALNLTQICHETSLDLTKLPQIEADSTRASINRISGRGAIALLLAGGDPHKRYPSQMVTQLLRQRPRNEGPFVLVFGPQEVQDYAEFIGPWSEAAQGDLEICTGGITDIIHILTHCSAAIANDCGFMHIAIAMGIPTLALFGPSNARAWFPYGPPHIALVANTACRPCFGAARSLCSNNICMTEFNASAIWTRYTADLTP